MHLVSSALAHRGTTHVPTALAWGRGLLVVAPVLPAEARRRLNAVALRYLRARHGYVRAVEEETGPVADGPAPPDDLDSLEGGSEKVA